MDELRKNLTAIAASLQVLAANTTANTDDLEAMEKRLSEDLHRMAARGRQTEEAVESLRGTFASIEGHLVKLFERDAEMRENWLDLRTRLEAVERKLAG